MNAFCKKCGAMLSTLERDYCLTCEAFGAGSEPVVSGIEAEVCRDIGRRQALGLKKYGTTVAANPLELKAWLQHAYEEALDQAIYLKRAIRELKKEGK